MFYWNHLCSEFYLDHLATYVQAEHKWSRGTIYDNINGLGMIYVVP